MDKTIEALQDEELIKYAITFVQAGIPIPVDVETKLEQLGLLTLITNPIPIEALGEL